MQKASEILAIYFNISQKIEHDFMTVISIIEFNPVNQFN